MAQPTLEQVFGVGTSQTFNELIIPKQNFENRGLTASEENTAESMLAAIILQAANYLTEGNQEQDPDIQITLEREDDSIITREDAQYRQYTYIVNLRKEEVDSSIDPDFF